MLIVEVESGRLVSSFDPNKKYDPPVFIPYLQNKKPFFTLQGRWANPNDGNRRKAVRNTPTRSDYPKRT